MEKNNSRVFCFLMGMVLLAGSFLWVSCTDEQVITGGGSGSFEETLVKLTIHTPGTTTPGAANRSGADIEHVVNHVQVLVFELRGGQYLFKYRVEGEQLTPDATDAQKTNFLAKLQTSSTPLKLLMVANAENLVGSYIPEVNSREEEVRKSMVTFFDGAAPDKLPMYGEKRLASLVATDVNSFTVKMLRGVARVDVEVDLDTSKSRSFVLEKVYIYRANQEVQVVPTDGLISNPEYPVVSAPSVPDLTEKAGPYGKAVSSTGDQQIGKLYVAAALPASDPALDFGEVTCVVVGGYYNGESTLSYYRADFNSGQEGHLYGQILRNHRYLFKVKQVNTSGWTNPDDAANNRSTQITMEIQTWEDFTMEMYVEGDKYLGVDSRELVLGYEAGLRKRVGVQSTVPYKVSWVEGEESITLGEEKKISNGYFTVEIQVLPDPGTGKEVSYLWVSSLIQNDKVNNPSGNNFYSILKVEWGSWIFYIDVCQLHATYYVKDPSKMRSMKVLSTNIAGTGQLGTANYGATGVGMRKILDNPDYFSPDGVVDYLSGVSFNATYRDGYILADPNSTNATYRHYANRVRTEVYSADVIYLNNDNAVGPYAAEVILEWLNASPNRVLIVGCDNANTSNALLQENPNREYKGWLKEEVDFWYNAGAGTSYQTENIGYGQHFFLVNDSRDSERKDFYEGPFGKVAENTQFQCVDGYYGFTKNYDQNRVLPLVYHKNATAKGYASSLSIGVNKERRIIYMGDASLWDEGVFNQNYAGANGTTGKITTDVHRFWANLWAWIAHQVIWGEEEIR